MENSTKGGGGSATSDFTVNKKNKLRLGWVSLRLVQLELLNKFEIMFRAVDEV